ncbi:acyl-CoA/acyl-ACP dehydrogenase [Ramlibacter sp. G-1-2-2]|uniref:Acyl-CoA/acyl-ACP dehydrogenase n=1 Tax=Ramlibacter agri TaxID=2728837 RepID=A0A848H3S1_9BURK|nr:acyl-CoA dehydrogenase family protein [Ramlibacter agri]NML44372.1 acyl-CoA/acyl-ACP dehydrogenase [Ramlibacter agri]
MAVPAYPDLAPLLARLGALFDAATAALAGACSEGGKLSAAALDRQQGACFALAWARADLEAARALAAPDSWTPLQQALAAAFVAEAIPAVLARLETIHLDLGVELQALHALATAPELAVLRRGAASSQALASLGARVIAGPAEALALPSADEGVAMAREAFARFASEAVAPLAQPIHREDRDIPETLLQPLREMGVFGLSIPQEYGGSASGGAHDNALMLAVTEVLSEASLGAAGSLITRPEILARALLAGGTPEQQQQWLPRIASGEQLCAISITEPDHGSDVAGLTLSATPVQGGWRLQGAKTWCTFAGKAQLLMVVARTDRDRRLGHRGLSVFLVEKPAFDGHEFHCESPGGGTLTGRAIPTLGYRGMHSFDLAFDDFFVPAASLVGGEAGLGKGFYFTMAGMTGGRLQTAGRACGVMRAAISAAAAYARDRRVFGAPLASYPLTEIKLAHMAARYLACRELAETTARAGDGATLSLDASLAKLLACRSAELLTREAQQLHGGLGYAEEALVSRLFVDARVLSIFEGAEETLALKVIARGLLEGAAA